MNARIAAFFAATLAAGVAVAEGVSQPLTMEEQRQRYLASVPEWGEPARQMEQYQREVEAASSPRPGRAYSLEDVERRNHRMTVESRLEALAKSCRTYRGGKYRSAQALREYCGRASIILLRGAPCFRGSEPERRLSAGKRPIAAHARSGP